MDEMTRKVMGQRLASAAGHIKGIERMLQANASCIDLIRQIQAVQAALNRVSVMMLDNHLRTCMTTAVQGADIVERERVLQEVTAVFEVSNKLSLSTQRRFNQMNTKIFNVPNISCGHCTHTIEMEVGELAGVQSVSADQESKQVTVSWQDPATWEQIQATLQEINYPPEGVIQVG